MPANSFSGTRDVVAEVDALASYEFPRTVAFADVSDVPAGGTSLELPDDPQQGDWYGWGNPDLSASTPNPIRLTLSAAAIAAGITIQGASSQSFTTPGTSGIARFFETANAWALFLGSAGAAPTLPAGLMHFGTGSPNANGFVQGESSAGLSVVTPGPVTAGNLLVVLIQTESAIPSVPAVTVTDDLVPPTVYTAEASSTGNPGVNAIVYTGVPTVSGVATILGNQGPSFARTSVAEFENTGATVDVVNVGYAVTTLALTTTHPLELVVGLVASVHSSNTFTPGAPLVGVVTGLGADSSFIEAGTAVGAGAQSFSYAATATDNTPFFVLAFDPVPFTSVGQDGDGYIDTTTKQVFGPRTAGFYPLIGTLT